MSDLVDSSAIERIVGARRHPTRHIARAVSPEERVYLLHSSQCQLAQRDLRLCSFSLAMDAGIDVDRWPQDRPLWVVVESGRLVPARAPANAAELLDQLRVLEEEAEANPDPNPSVD
ncbi:MAG: hypothetical protein KGL39_48975 [Patescibacteria group bacterium]|nr:hypothetical protein [Patescibacteria group bacterium]